MICLQHKSFETLVIGIALTGRFTSIVHIFCILIFHYLKDIFTFRYCVKQRILLSLFQAGNHQPSSNIYNSDNSSNNMSLDCLKKQILIHILSDDCGWPVMFLVTFSFIPELETYITFSMKLMNNMHYFFSEDLFFFIDYCHLSFWREEAKRLKSE